MNAPFEFFGSPEGASSDELRARLQRLEALISHAPVPIAIAHDPGCRVISANAALAELLGVPASANISLTPPPGEQPRYRIQRDGKDIPTDQLPMQYAIAHRTSIRNDIEILRADGTVRYIQNDVEPLYAANGEVSGCVSVCVDLTEQKRAERQLLEADRTKDEFLAILSHELRNPLTPIRNALEVLRRSGHDPLVAGRAYAVMERQVYQLVRLTDDLLDVSRITRDQIDLRRERIDLRLALQSAVETTQPLIDVAGHLLSIELPRDPIWVDADSARMTQAFANLLNNAVKYTDRGGRITVRASVDSARAIVTVTDTGIGIAADVLPRIFDMFMRSDDSPDRVREGLGIGLTLAKRLIELHEGTIEALSDGPGRGTTFVIRLPLTTPMTETPPG
jgi:signal transduction histidine kinase